MSRSEILEKLMKSPRYAEQIRKAGADQVPADPARPKFGNVKTVDAGGRLCDSKLEAVVSNRFAMGKVAMIQQVSIPLSSRKRDRMILDFLVIDKIHEDGSFEGYFADAKGLTTKDWIQKQRRFEDLYGLNIILIKK